MADHLPQDDAVIEIEKPPQASQPPNAPPAARTSPFKLPLPPRTMMAAGGGVTLLLLVMLVALVGRNNAVPPGPWEPYVLEDEAVHAQEQANEKAESGLPEVAGNRVPKKQAARVNHPDSPLVRLTLPGHGGPEQPAAPVLRLETARAVTAVLEEIKATLDLDVVVVQGWQSRAEYQSLLDSAPTLAAQPFASSYMTDGLDISRLDAQGRKPLTLGLDGKAIFLEDLQNSAGKARFAAVIKRIESDAINASSANEPRVVSSWLASAEEDFNRGVWGVHEATMDIWLKHGWAVGHCQETSGRSWHAEPNAGASQCKRYSPQWVNRILEYRASPGPTQEYIAAARELAGTHEFEPYVMPDEERQVNDAVNLGLPDDHSLISFNRASPKVSRGTQEPDNVLVFLTLPGKDGRGKPQKVLGRLRTARLVATVANEIQEKFGLAIRANFLWRNNARQMQLRSANPKLAARPGQSNHFVDAADISRAEATGKNVLTLGTDGQPVMLADLKTENGKERFREVIRRIEAETLARAAPAVHASIVEDWVTTARADYDAGVWGMTDLTMELWREHGWTTGHCGEISYETWHTEPIKRMKNCERWDKTYNARIKKYRKRPPIDEDKAYAEMMAAMAQPLPNADVIRAQSLKARCGAGCQFGKLVNDVGSSLKKVKLGF